MYFLVAKLLELEIDCLAHSNEQKHAIQSNAGVISPEDLFYEINTYINPYLSVEDLKRYIPGLQEPLYTHIFHKLDLNFSSKVSLNDFVKSIKPLSLP